MTSNSSHDSHRVHNVADRRSARGHAGDEHHGRVDAIEVSVDEVSEVFLGLHACKGSTQQRTFRARSSQWSMCHNGAWDPFSAIRSNCSQISYDDENGVRQMPLIVHASGAHDRLQRAVHGTHGAHGRPLPPSLRSPTALKAAWQDLFGFQRLLDVPVLLIDGSVPHAAAADGKHISQNQEICTLTTLRQLCPFNCTGNP